MKCRSLLLLTGVCLAQIFAVSSASATSVVPPKFAELVNGADYIVRARVKGISYAAKERPGKPPLIYTNVALEVLETIAGNPPAEPVLRVLGGKIGDAELRVEGLPRFEVGQEEVMFVRGNGRTFYPLYAAMHGRYSIKRDAAGREFIARSNGVQLDDVAEVATPMVDGPAAQLQQRMRSSSTALSPAAFIQRVREYRTGGRANEK
jgi:hypothetical protein